MVSFNTCLVVCYSICWDKNHVSDRILVSKRFWIKIFIILNNLYNYNFTQFKLTYRNIRIEKYSDMQTHKAKKKSKTYKHAEKRQKYRIEYWDLTQNNREHTVKLYLFLHEKECSKIILLLFYQLSIVCAALLIKKNM